MSQNDFTLANQSFPAFRADLNSALQALATNSSGGSAPSTTFANMWWYDTSNNIMYIRNEDNDAWIKFAELDQANDKFVLSGTLQLDDGTVSAPALTFNSDTNMGIYRGGTDILKFVTAGTDAITIDASQNVTFGSGSNTTLSIDSSSAFDASLTTDGTNQALNIIGTNNSSNGNVYIKTGGTGTPLTRARFDPNGDISFYEDTGTTPKLFWDASEESLGIGTTSPNFSTASGSAKGLEINGTVPAINLNAGSSDEFLIYGGGSSANILVANNNPLRIITGGSEAMRIDSSGNVGIGSSPNEKLTINSGALSFLGDISTPSIGAGLFRPANNTLAFVTGSTEAMRIDSSQNLLVGVTSTTIPGVGNTTEGVSLRGSTGSASSIFASRAVASAGYFNINADGDILSLRRSGTQIGSIGYISTGLFIEGESNHSGWRFGAGGIAPFKNGADTDNTTDVGTAAARLDDVHATNGTIQTSDRNEKQDIEELSEAEQRVAVVAKGLMRKFRWIDSVAEKGDNARTHFGVIAQDLQDAFTAEGLDASKYAMFCSDTWWEKEISVDAVEADEQNGIEAKDAYTYMDTKDEATEGYTEKTRLGIRYNQLLAFIISAI